MAGINDYSNTAGSNTTINGIDIAEGCSPAGINNAIRQLMADIADMDDGVVPLQTPDINGGTIDGAVIGGTTPAAGTFTNLTATGTLTGLLGNVVEDATPQLGGNLDLNSNDITGTGNINITGTATVTGLTTTGDINFGDNDKANFGASNDLAIYHTGNDSVIEDVGTGDLEIRSNGTGVFLQKGTSEYLARFLTDGANELYYDNSKKLETTSTGIDVTGTVVSDGLQVSQGDTLDISGNAGEKIYSQSAGYVDLESRSGIRFYGDWNGNGAISTPEFEVFTGGTAGIATNKKFEIKNGGDISFYEDTGTTPKFFWDASAERLGIGTTSPASNLDIRTISGTINDLNQTLTIEERTAWTQGIAIAVYNADLYASDRPSAFLGTVNNLSSFILSGGARVTNNPDGGSWATPVGTASTFLRATNGEFRVYGNTGLTADTVYTPTERMRIDSTGNVIVGGNSTGNPTMRNKSGDQTAGNPQFSFVGNVGTGMRRVQTDTIAFDTGSVERMRIDSSGNVGIGTTSPSEKLDVSGTVTANSLLAKFNANLYMNIISPATGGVNGQIISSDNNLQLIAESSSNASTHILFKTTDSGSTTERMRIDSSGNVGIGDSTPDATLDVVGNIHYTGTITDVSDRRLKENIADLSDSLNKICQLNAKSYTLIADRNNEEDTTELGFIAQDVQTIYPEIVKNIQKYAVDENGENTEKEINYLGVSYIQLIAPMVEAIKELKADNDALRTRIETLENA